LKRKIALVSGWGAGRDIFDKIEKKLSDDFDFDYIPWEKCSGDNGYAAGLIKSSGKKRIIMGWSLGGLIAMKTSLEIPDRISGLVLISSTPKMTADEGYEGAAAREIKAMAARLEKYREGVLESFAKKAFGGDDAQAEKYMDEAAGFNSGELRAGLEYLEKTDLRREIGKIKGPVLILHGNQDPIIPASQARFMNQNIAGSELSLFEARHGLPYSLPGRAIELIRDFKWI
jgi:pimeloyl-[acyl-carrier protein] methyl ester esterase